MDGTHSRVRRSSDRWLLGMGLVLSLLVLSAGIAYRNTRQLRYDAESVAHTQEVLNALETLLATAKDAEMGQRGFVITGKRSYLQPYEDARTTLDQQVTRVGRLTGDNERQQALVPPLQEKIATLLDRLRQAVAGRTDRGFEAAEQGALNDQVQEAMDDLRGLIGDMRREEVRLLKVRSDQSNRTYQVAVASGLVTALLGLGAVGAFLYLLRRHFHVRVQAAVARKQEQTRVVDTLESITDGFMQLDRDWHIVYMNPEFERQCDRPRSEQLGKVFWDEWPATLGTTLEVELRKAVAGQAPVQFENYYAPFERWFELKANPLPEGGLAVFCRDVTDRKQADDKVRASEARFRQLANAIPQLAWMAYPDGHIYWYNQRWFDYTGTTLEQMAGWGWQSVHDAAVLPQVLERWQASIRGGETFDMVFPLRGADGQFRPFLTRVMPLRGADGAILQWFGTNTDLSEQVAAEENLRESERRLRFVMDSMPQKIFTARPNGDVDYFNPQWMEFTGLTFEQIRDWGWTQFVHPDDVADNVRLWRHAVAAGEPFRYEQRFRRADGVFHWHISRAVPLRDAAGRIALWVGSNTDIEEVKQAEEALKAADRRKDEFLATLAHELRNPLAPIRNALQIMRLAGDNREAVEQARAMMERQLQQMVRLVDDLLDVSRITRNKLELRRQRVELAAVVQAAVETSRPLIDASGHALTVTLHPQRLFLDADLTRLAQVVSNLLNNAAKYTERGGRLGLTTERHGSDAVVSVKDNGTGIPADMLARVFEMFTQVDRSLERSQGGLGIGLTLVKRLAELHGGSVEARSDGPGKGSEFIVRLPLLLTPAGQDRPSAEDAGGQTSASPKGRVLVVDDNRDSATSLGMMLAITGYEIRTAHDGLEAVEVAAAFRPDVVLLDIGLPRLNGYDVARRLREQPWGKTALLIATTGWGQEEDRRRSQEAGFDHHLVKPVDPAALILLLVGSHLKTVKVGD